MHAAPLPISLSNLRCFLLTGVEPTVFFSYFDFGFCLLKLPSDFGIWTLKFGLLKSTSGISKFELEVGFGTLKSILLELLAAKASKKEFENTFWDFKNVFDEFVV